MSYRESRNKLKDRRAANAAARAEDMHRRLNQSASAAPVKPATAEPKKTAGGVTGEK